MNTGRRIRLLWAGTMTCFFALFSGMLSIFSIFSTFGLQLRNQRRWLLLVLTMIPSLGWASHLTEEGFPNLEPTQPHTVAGTWVYYGMGMGCPMPYQTGETASLESGVQIVKEALRGCRASEPYFTFIEAVIGPRLVGPVRSVVPCYPRVMMPSGECADSGWGVSVSIVGYYWAGTGPAALASGWVTKYIYVNFNVNQPPCTIKLSGLPADIEPGKEVKSLRADVTCDGVPTPKAVELTVKAEANTGGHNHHDSARPTGTLNPASGNSPVTFSFTAPDPAGDHTITAKCVDGSCGEDTGKVWAGIQGLVPLYDTQLYKLVGSDDAHPNNHYLTTAATGSVVWLAELYRARFPNDPVLRLNDASLERGGLFDIKHDRRTQWWTPPHETHQRGIDIDVRANEFVHADSIPHRNYFDFEDIAIDVRCIAGMHSEFTRNQHYHVTCR